MGERMCFDPNFLTRMKGWVRITGNDLSTPALISTPLLYYVPLFSSFSLHTLIHCIGFWPGPQLMLSACVSFYIFYKVTLHFISITDKLLTHRTVGG